MTIGLWPAPAKPLGGRRGRRTMKNVGIGLALPSVIAATVFATVAFAEDTKTEVPKQELQAKLAYCQVCHGPSGQGFRGYYPIPRLAGQQPEYFENQLQAFIDRRRTNVIMFNVAHVLSPAMLAALAASFHAFDPKPLGGAPKDLIEAGKKIYQDGIPSADIPACASCHGPEAKGDGQFPRLAGQLNDYIFNKLTNWSKERGQNPSNPDASAIMEPIAHGLNKQQIEAVAAYVSYLE
jgi:cytochrome c553